MITTVQKWGNSQGIRLPKIFLDNMNIREGEKVEVSTKNDAIIIKRTVSQRKTIQELFEGYDGDYTPEMIDWGEPVGSEIW